MKQYLLEIYNNIHTVITTDKNHILDSATAASVIIWLTQHLDGLIKIVGYITAGLLLIRTLYGLYKDRLDVQSKKLDIEIKEKQLKKQYHAEKIMEEDIS